MIKSSWNKLGFSANKGRKWLEKAKRKLTKARNGIPAMYMHRPWPSGNKIRDH